MKFTSYQKFVIAVLAFLQFTVVLDFMILSPLGALLLKELHVSTKQFGAVVSAYAFSASAAGILAAGFADKFDRKKLLLFFYSGFVLGTFLCGIAWSYEFLFVARMVTGLFGGVIGSISFAIIADLFPFEGRGRVMGFVMTAFSASQVLGIPLGLYLSNRWGWHAPFLMIVAVSAAVGVLIALRLKPIDEHLKTPSDRNALRHLLKTLAEPRYFWAFAATMLLAVGGFMLMPFGSTFSVYNMGIPLEKLPMIYIATGVSSFIAGPLLGRVSDQIGKYPMFCIGSSVGIALVIYYCGLGLTPLGVVIALNIVLFIAITARMVSAQALSSAVPDPGDRGAFMSINSSLQQLAGGVASSSAGFIVVQTAQGPLEHYQELGYVVAAAMLITMILMFKVNRIVRAKLAAGQAVPENRAHAGPVAE
ncbi:MAG TPA: MFS transporter [Polyangiaceae bacterium]|nr:MFS transporter [Polyangiaceae bacterium]